MLRLEPMPDCLGIPYLQIYQKLLSPLTVASRCAVPAPLFDISGQPEGAYGSSGNRVRALLHSQTVLWETQGTFFYS